jgi:hypothetical protein
VDSGDVLIQLQKTYLAAPDAPSRVEAIQQFRLEHPLPPANPDPALLLPVLEGLLHYTLHDTAPGRFAAARLLRDLWCSLPPAAIDELFHEFTWRLIECCPARGTVERGIVWETIDGGFRIATPAVVASLCQEITTREASRCLDTMAPYYSHYFRIGGFSFGFEPAPNLDLLRLVVQYAPGDVWPRLVRDLWMLYNLDIHFAENLALSAKLPIRGIRCRVEVRGTFDGQKEHVDRFWDVAERMLHRTLTEARPEDLRDAAPGFFAWLESLTVLSEEEREPFLQPMTTWAVPQMLRVLERWSEIPTVWELLKGGPPNGEFRRKVAQAFGEVRAALGIGPELVPASAPQGVGSEPTPACHEGS